MPTQRLSAPFSLDTFFTQLIEFPLRNWVRPLSDIPASWVNKFSNSSKFFSYTSICTPTHEHLHYTKFNPTNNYNMLKYSYFPKRSSHSAILALHSHLHWKVLALMRNEIFLCTLNDTFLWMCVNIQALEYYKQLEHTCLCMCMCVQCKNAS